MCLRQLRALGAKEHTATLMKPVGAVTMDKGECERMFSHR